MIVPSYVFVAQSMTLTMFMYICIFLFQAEDGIRYLVRSRGLGDVYKRQVLGRPPQAKSPGNRRQLLATGSKTSISGTPLPWACLLYTSDAADERSSVDLGGRRIIKKKRDSAQKREQNDRHKW